MTANEIYTLALEYMKMDMQPRQSNWQNLTFNAFLGDLNRAQERVAQMSRYVKRGIVLTVTADQGEYAYEGAHISRKLLVPHVVYRTNADGDEYPLYDHEWLPAVTNYNDFATIYPNWANQPSGQVRMAVAMPEDTLLLFPAPDTDEAADSTFRIEGHCLPIDLVNTNSVPELPSHMHKIIAKQAVLISAEAFMTEGNAFARADKYEKDVKDACKAEATRTARQQLDPSPRNRIFPGRV